jgi:hypothetical protein
MRLFPTKFTLLSNERITVKATGEEAQEMVAWTEEQWGTLYAQIRNAAMDATTKLDLARSKVEIRKCFRKKIGRS